MYAFMDLETAQEIKNALREKTGVEFTLAEVKTMVRVPGETDHEVYAASKGTETVGDPLLTFVATIVRYPTGIIKNIHIQEVPNFKSER